MLDKFFAMHRTAAILLPCMFALAVAKGESGYHLNSDTGITLPKGFDAEILYEVPPSQGSWVAMGFASL